MGLPFNCVRVEWLLTVRVVISLIFIRVEGVVVVLVFHHKVVLVVNIFFMFVFFLDKINFCRKCFDLVQVLFVPLLAQLLHFLHFGLEADSVLLYRLLR